MNDIDKLIHILETLNINYADYYSPDGSAEVQICDYDYKVIGVVWFDVNGIFKNCYSCDG